MSPAALFTLSVAFSVFFYAAAIVNMMGMVGTQRPINGRVKAHIAFGSLAAVATLTVIGSAIWWIVSVFSAG